MCCSPKERSVFSVLSILVSGFTFKKGLIVPGIMEYQRKRGHYPLNSVKTNLICDCFMVIH